MMRKLLFILVSILSFALFSNVFAQENVPPQVEIAGTQKLSINSSIVGQEYDLYINLPRGYQDTGRSFPVIYLLDAQWDFTLVNAIYGEQYYDGFLPDIITVGITWGGINPNPDSLRRIDFTPSKEKENLIGGGAEKFLSFIKDELIPFIDSKFRTVNDDRTLMGSSLGGLFTLYTLFNETELFNRYVLTSPAIGWDNEIIYSYEKKYNEHYSGIPIKLSMAIGEYEDVASFQKFADNLKEKNGMEMKTMVLDGIGHSGSKAGGYTKGLQFVFERQSLNIDSSILEHYVGTYQTDPEFKVKILKGNDHLLLVQILNSMQQTLYAESEKDFYAKGQYFFIHFKSDDVGKILGFQLERFGREDFVKKIN